MQTAVLVIDVSGDGRSNNRQISGTGSYSSYSYCTSSGNSSCIQVDNARDAAVALGITINGLPIDPTSNQSIKAQYQQSVVGGSGAFVELSNGFNDFVRAATEKIKREIQESVYKVTDEDGDGITDFEEGKDPTNPRDTDGDGTPDYQDPDSDNDGIPDIEEGENNGTEDKDNNNVPDYLEPGPHAD